MNRSRVPHPQPDGTEKMLRRAMEAAQLAYQRGTEESRPLLRRTCIHSLRAYHFYVEAQTAQRGPDLADASSAAPSEQSYEALMVTCGLV